MRERWLALNDTIGDAVSIDGLTGLARDLDGAGALLVDDGATVHRVIAGATDDAARR